MVWIVIGRRTKTERVPGGLVVDRDCPACGEHASFYERRAVRTFRLYFLDVFDYDKQRVMACGACGTLFATEEHGPPSAEDAEGWREALDKAQETVSGAAKRAGEALGPALENAAPMAKRAGDNVRELFTEAGEALGPLAKKAQEGLGQAFGTVSEELRRIGGEDDEAFDDDEDVEEEELPESARERDPEKRDLLRRFEELERKLKKNE